MAVAGQLLLLLVTGNTVVRDSLLLLLSPHSKLQGPSSGCAAGEVACFTFIARDVLDNPDSQAWSGFRCRCVDRERTAWC